MGKGFLKHIRQRIYSDFLMPSRLEEYRGLLITAVDLGYDTYSIVSFWSELSKGLKPDSKYLILRHDIDTDTETAKLMFEVERKLGINASYYFRLSTIDIDLMQSIDFFGSEASYHFEEIATIAKQRCVKTRDEMVCQLEDARELFKGNLEELRKQTGLPMVTVASHGDFVNRSLNMPNWELLNNDLRDDLSVALEVYEKKINSYVTSRHSDAPYPHFWKPTDPIDAMKRGEPVVYLLTHPRHWRSNLRVNLEDNLLRAWQGSRHRFLSKLR